MIFSVFGFVLLCLVAVIFVITFLSNGADYGAVLAAISPIFWLFGKIFPHPPLWREMTGKADYGRSGRHWGTYHGSDERECFLCGQVKMNFGGQWQTDPNNKGNHTVKPEDEI